MTRQSKEEYLSKIRERYARAGRTGRSKLLDECEEVCGYDRKYLIRFLGHPPKPVKCKPGPKSKYALSGVLKALEDLWLLMNRPCSKLFQGNMPVWLPFYERDHRMAAETKEKLLQISPATIDRLMKPVRRKHGSHGLGGTKPNLALKFQIPIRTHHGDVDRPGYLQADTVAHGGNSVEGDFVWTLTMTDVQTQWTENRGVWAKGYHGVAQAIKSIEEDLPFSILGFHSDNGGEFLNHHLWRYFRDRDDPVSFTRTRPDHKDDNAYAEQRNWTHVRQLLGYQRIENPDLLPIINELYQAWDLMHNLFCCTQKLESKTKEGSRYRRRYEKTPKTPAQRLIESEHINEAVKTHLTEKMTNINPIELKKFIYHHQDVVISQIR
jgi:hypothetical protein